MRKIERISDEEMSMFIELYWKILNNAEAMAELDYHRKVNIIYNGGVRGIIDIDENKKQIWFRNDANDTEFRQEFYYTYEELKSVKYTQLQKEYILKKLSSKQIEALTKLLNNIKALNIPDTIVLKERGNWTGEFKILNDVSYGDIWNFINLFKNNE